MPIPTDVRQLTALFRRLGAADPEGWAKSQIDEGINHLHRYLFLRQAWARVIAEDDQSWIDRAVAESKQHPEAPYAGIGHSLSRLLAAIAFTEETVQ